MIKLQHHFSSFLEKCLEFLTNENGNLRLAAANAIHYLRPYLSKADSTNVYNKILKLREEISDKKRKTTSIARMKIGTNSI